MTTPLKKDTLIDLYWILDAVRNGTEANPARAAACFVEIRDALMRPDTEEIVDHIRVALLQQQSAADVLARAATTRAMRTPLPDGQLIELMEAPAVQLGIAEPAATTLALLYGRLVEAAHGIRPEA